MSGEIGDLKRDSFALEIVKNLGFRSWDEYERYWREENTRSGKYVPPVGVEPIIREAANGRRFNLREDPEPSRS